MTNEEMAQLLDIESMYHSNHGDSVPSALRAGAAALRALEWRPIESAPKGRVTEDVGCRGESEWFIGLRKDGGWTLAMDDLRRFADRLSAERDQLRAKLAAAVKRAEHAESELEDLRDGPAEHEQACGEALRGIAKLCRYEEDQEGTTAEYLRDHIEGEIEDLRARVTAAERALAEERVRLAVAVKALEAANEKIEEIHDEWAEPGSWNSADMGQISARCLEASLAIDAAISAAKGE